MNCKEAEKLMTDFLDYSLSGDDLNCFIKHIHNCPECMEELGTSYLLSDALLRIEEGESVMLDYELRNRIMSAQTSYRLHMIFANGFRSLEVVAGIILSLLFVKLLVTYLLPLLTH